VEQSKPLVRVQETVTASSLTAKTVVKIKQQAVLSHIPLQI